MAKPSHIPPKRKIIRTRIPIIPITSTLIWPPPP
jgi:hypothetical protein